MVAGVARQRAGGGRSISIDPRQLQRGLEVLRREREDFVFTPREALVLAMLRWTLVGASAVLLAMFGRLLLETALGPWPSKSETFEVVSLSVLGVGLLLIAVLLVLNVPVVRKLWRQRRLVRRLGLDSSLRQELRRQRRGTPRQRRQRWLFAILLGPLAYLVLSVTWPFLLVLYVIERSRAVHRLVLDVDRLETVLRGAALSDGHQQQVEVPVEAIEQLSRIEAGQIARERARAVRQGMAGARSMYGVRMLDGPAAQRALLDLPSRMAVEELLSSLAGGAPSQSEERDGIRLARTSEGGVTLRYRVDDARGELTVLSIERGPRSAAMEGG